MKKYAVIVAGGLGTRMGSTTPKQYVNLLGKPILWYTINTFLEAFDDLRIILVVAGNHLETAKEVLCAVDHPERVSITTGGPTRFHSVKNGLNEIRERSIVFVHDGVRCLLTVNLIRRCYEVALQYGNAVPAIQAVDSIRLETTEGNKVLNREQVRLVQTPQTFHSEIIKDAFEQDFDPVFTDEASLVERRGIKINLVEGEVTNIKITRPIDILIAEKILEENQFI